MTNTMVAIFMYLLIFKSSKGTKMPPTYWLAELRTDPEPSDTKFNYKLAFIKHSSLCLSSSWTSGSHVYPDSASVKLMT